jgi:sulfite reductase (NADPH) flavoprotein alpha-component
MTTTTDAGVVPSRQVLTEIEDTRHEHLGPLSSAHGFLLSSPPPTSFPPSHRAWDDLAAELPSLWRDVAVRGAVSDLPVLPAGATDLPDEFLWRASMVLGSLAYSYARCDIDDLHRPAPVPLPVAIALPWTEVARRMQRRAAHLAFDDMFVHNWRPREPGCRDPKRVENLDLLVPLLGNGTEHTFALVNIEMVAQCGPLVEAAVQAQEAVADNDPARLCQQLLVMLDRVRHVTEISLQKLDPNPHARHHADPALWGKLVAPLGIPILDGGPGLSGAGSTPFQLLDAFLGRTRYRSSLGQDARKVRAWDAPNVRRFLDAIEKISVRRYVERRGGDELQGAFRSLFEAYAGERGCLDVHRRKVYGFIEVTFKVGRPATASGISGGLRNRAWRETANHLEDARKERYDEMGTHAVLATLRRREPVTASGAGGMQHVELDIDGSGITFRPGDHCEVLAENPGGLVARCLEALRARGDEQVPLTAQWREALRTRMLAPAPDDLPLADFLRFAKLRPLLRPVGKRLAALSESEELHRVLEARQEDQWELGDALELAAVAGYDTTRLWRAPLWQHEGIARVVPPERFRTYSISGRPETEPFPSQLSLTVAALSFTGPGLGPDPVTRRGTASNFLTHDAPSGTRIPIRVFRPLSFRLPEDPAAPIVMFAGGSGIAPFRSFLQQRVADPRSGPTWLFFSARTEDEFPYRDELERSNNGGRLELRTAFSQATVDGVAPRRIGSVMEESANAAALWRLLRTEAEGGQGAFFYVCGRAAFAAAVMASLHNVTAAALSGSPAERDTEARAIIRQLVGERRLMQDVFTTFAPASAAGISGAGIFDASELVLHNDEEHGWWMAINGAVYDVTEFRHLHPGGFRIIDDNAGLDATSEYQAVLHHQEAQIEAMLDMYRIGTLRRLDFGKEWGIALSPEGLRYVSLHDLYTAWIRHLYLIVELENALRNDLGFLGQALTSTEGDGELTPLKLQLMVDVQRRFQEVYLDDALGAGVQELWALAAGLCDPDEDAGRLGRELGAVDAAPARLAVERLRDVTNGWSTGSPDRARAVAELASHLCAEDHRLLAELKQLLRQGLRVFEELEADAVRGGGRRLLDCLARVPAVLVDFQDRQPFTTERFMTQKESA